MLNFGFRKRVLLLCDVTPWWVDCCMWAHTTLHQNLQCPLSHHRIISSRVFKLCPGYLGLWRRLSKCRRWQGKESARSVKHGRWVTPCVWVRQCRRHGAASVRRGWGHGVGGWSTTWSAHSSTEKEATRYSENTGTVFKLKTKSILNLWNKIWPQFCSPYTITALNGQNYVYPKQNLWNM